MEGNGKLFEILQFNASEDTVDVSPARTISTQDPMFRQTGMLNRP